MSTTMALVRMLRPLLRDEHLGPRIVPIVSEEALMFGLDSLFKQIGIYVPDGQLYEPEGAGSMAHYHEARDGQLFEERPYRSRSAIALDSSRYAYSIHSLAMLPILIIWMPISYRCGARYIPRVPKMHWIN